jgi:hypothetical protein
VKTPPNSGPAVAPNPNLDTKLEFNNFQIQVKGTHINPTTAVNKGRLARGTACATTTKLPVKIPALPKPARALPTIKVTEFGAMPQIKLPLSNMAMDAKYDHFILKSMKILP